MKASSGSGEWPSVNSSMARKDKPAGKGSSRPIENTQPECLQPQAFEIRLVLRKGCCHGILRSRPHGCPIRKGSQVFIIREPAELFQCLLNRSVRQITSD